MKIVNAPTGTIQLLDYDVKELVFKAGRGIREDKMERRIKFNEGITGRVAFENKSILISDIREYGGSFIDVMHDETLSELAVPIAVGESVIGVLNVESPIADHFTERDKRLFVSLAGQSVIAIQNAQRFDALHKERGISEALARINRVIGGMQNVDEVIYALLDEIGNVLTVKNRGILLYDPDNDQLAIHPSAYYNIDADKARQTTIKVGMDSNPGLTAWAARHRKSVISNDVREDSRYFPLISDTRSELVVPMILREHLIGVINLESDKLAFFNKDDERLVEAIAEQVVLAIEKAEKNETIARHQRQAILQRKWVQIGELVATLTHRIGNDIGLIRVYAEKIKKVPNLDDYVRDQAENISNRSNEMIQMTKQFFGKGLSRVFAEDQQTVRTDVNKLISSAIERSPELDHFKLSIVVSSAPLYIYTDSHLLEEVFRELITNAVRATPEGGNIEIGLSKTEKMVQIWIADSGKGILPENAASVFKPFKKYNSEGYGFGLWWAKGFIQDQGGDINHRPNEKYGKGTIFTVTIPLEQSAQYE
jgi:signal transduction histidine kinase